MKYICTVTQSKGDPKILKRGPKGDPTLSRKGTKRGTNFLSNYRIISNYIELSDYIELSNYIKLSDYIELFVYVKIVTLGCIYLCKFFITPIPKNCILATGCQKPSVPQSKEDPKILKRGPNF